MFHEKEFYSAVSCQFSAVPFMVF